MKTNRLLKTYLFLMLLLFCNIVVSQTYNYKTAYEFYQNGDSKKAIEYFERELSDHPNSALSHYYMALIYLDYEKLSPALEHTNKALAYFPATDKKMRSKTFITKGDIHYKLGNIENTFKYYNLAITLDPQNIDNYLDRANYFFEEKEFQKAEVDYKHILTIDESNVIARAGLARNYIEEKKYDTALEILNKMVLLEENYSITYEYFAKIYFEQNKPDKAIPYILKAIDLDQEDQSLQKTFLEYSQKNYNLALAKINNELLSEPKNEFWICLRAKLHAKNINYKASIDDFTFILEKLSTDKENEILAFRGEIYLEAGLYHKALKDFTKWIMLDSINPEPYSNRVLTLCSIKRYNDALQDLDKSIELAPLNPWHYHIKGNIYQENLNNIELSLKNYNTAIDIDNTFAYSYLYRGLLYNEKLNDSEKAKKDFETILSIDKEVIEIGNCLQYALFYLGKSEESLDWMNKILERYPNKYNFYDAASLNSLMNKTEESLYYLKKTLENGYYAFEDFTDDQDFDNVRNNPEFIKLLADWEKKYIESDLYKLGQENNIENSTSNTLNSAIQIPLKRLSGTYTIACKLNDLKLNFVFDTGAADISLSQNEVDFMLKNGYLSERDFIGQSKYDNAYGISSENKRINIQKVEIGGFVLNNIVASVVPNQKAPLLLGQSALSKYGSLTVDYKTNTLTIVPNSIVE